MAWLVGFGCVVWVPLFESCVLVVSSICGWMCFLLVGGYVCCFCDLLVFAAVILYCFVSVVACCWLLFVLMLDCLVVFCCCGFWVLRSFALVCCLLGFVELVFSVTVGWFG